MKHNEKLGGILALLGAIVGIAAHFILFLNWYHAGMSAESAEPGCEILLKYIHPGLTYLGLMGGVLFAVSAYGFFTRRSWAFALSVVGLVLSLLASWFINVPFMAAGLPPVYFSIFFPFLILYFLMLRLVWHMSWSRILLALGTGLAYILCFMNGVSSTSRIITVGAPIFTLVLGLHWIAMIAWAVVTVGILLKPAEWLRVLGITAAVAELVVGIPLAIETAGALGRFSLFALAPIGCLVLLVLLVIPNLWEKWTATT